MINNRKGEHGNIPGRSERIFQKFNYWYYSTREGVDIGPFDSQEDARIGAGEFVEFIQAAEPEMIATLEQYGRRAA